MQPSNTQHADAEPDRDQAAVERFLQRAITVTDGTVTRLIEAFAEPVIIQKLREQELPRGPLDAWPDLPAGVRVVARDVLIRGRISGRVFLHAQSLVVLDHLDDVLRRELLETEKPIGKLIREHRRESFRELLGHTVESAGTLAPYFDCRPEDPLVARVYRICLGGRPAIQITERFPGTLDAPGADRS